MYGVAWFKVDANIFANRKIQILLGMKDGDTYFRAWMQLIALAVECNKQGKLVIGDGNPMKVQTFSKIMGKSNKKVEEIMRKFVELGMLIYEGNTFLIKNWDKYQSIDSYEKVKEQNRQRQAKFREKNKGENEKSNVTVTDKNTKEEKEDTKEKDITENIIKENENGFKEYQI